MKRLAPETKKEIIHFFLTTATKRILDERKADSVQNKMKQVQKN